MSQGICEDEIDADVPDLVSDIKSLKKPVSAQEICDNFPTYRSHYAEPEKLSEMLWQLATDGKLKPHSCSPNKVYDTFVPA